MAYQPMVFRPTSKALVDHINQRSQECGSRNQYVLSLVRADMDPAAIKGCDTTPDALEVLARKVAGVLLANGMVMVAPGEQIKITGEVSAEQMKSLINQFENV